LRPSFRSGHSILSCPRSQSALDFHCDRCRSTIEREKEENPNTAFASFCGDHCLICLASGGFRTGAVRWSSRRRIPNSELRTRVDRRIAGVSRGRGRRRERGRFFLLTTNLFFLLFFLFFFCLGSHDHFGIGVVVHQPGISAPSDHRLEDAFRIFVG